MTSADPGPLVQRMVLGAELRELRDGAGLSTDDVAAQLGWYRAKLSKIEKGEAKLSQQDVDACLTLYKTDSDRSAKVRRLAKEARRRTPTARVSDWAKKYTHLEASASELKMFFPDIVPGAVQTTEYARELVSASVVVPTSNVEEIAESREARARRFFEPNAPLLWLVLGEEAIKRPIGSRAVHTAQLNQLCELSALDHVSLQIMPVSYGAHPGLGLAFTLLHLESASSTVVYTESLTGADYLTRPQHTRAYSLVFDRLRVAALSERDSLALIERERKAIHQE